MSATSLFISYSRRDRVFVDRLARDLEANGFDVWTDTADLAPGTANWEKAIREAIQQATAVILVASPDSLLSDYVQGELTVAQSFERPIYPIWAAGGRWIDCVPLEMAKAQYVDGRGDLYALSIIQLSDTIKKNSTPSGDEIQVSLPYHDVLTIPPHKITDIRSLLNRVYMFHLEQWYEPYTYGRDWVLGHITTRRIALPWGWLLHPLDEQPTSWDNYPLKVEDYGILPGSHWGVWDLARIHVIGLAINSAEMAEALQAENSVYNLILRMRDGKLRAALPENVDPDAYRHTFFIGLIGVLGQQGTRILRNLCNSAQIETAPNFPNLVLVDD